MIICFQLIKDATAIDDILCLAPSVAMKCCYAKSRIILCLRLYSYVTNCFQLHFLSAIGKSPKISAEGRDAENDEIRTL